MDDPLGVTRDEVLYSVEMKELTYSNSCCTCTVEYDLDIFLLFSCHLQCIDESCEDNYGSAMLVIMHHWDIELSLESILDLETPRSRDILEIDPTESIGDIFHCLDEFLCVLSPDDDRECIHSCEFLKQDTLPFHNWHRCLVSEIPETEDS